MTNAELLEKWNRLTPQQRDYDRFVARCIPDGASWRAETLYGQMLKDEIVNSDYSNNDCCSCHISAPCSFCLQQETSE